MKRAVAALAFGALLASCNPQAPKSSPSPSVAPSHGAAGIPLHVSGHGTASQPLHFFGQRADDSIEYEMLAARAESEGPAGRVRATFVDPRITFHDRNGSNLDANAPQAVLDQTENTITLLGGVKARGANGMTLSCDQLEYDRASQTLRGTGHVVITDPKGFRGTGNAFQSDISLTHYRMQ